MHFFVTFFVQAKKVKNKNDGKYKFNCLQKFYTYKMFADIDILNKSDII